MFAQGEKDSQDALGYIVASAEFHREGDQVLAFCPQLGISSFGRDLAEAERMLTEAIDLHLCTLESLGQRENFFAYHNIIVCADYPEDTSLFVQTAPDSWVKVFVQPLGHPPEAGNRAPHPLAPSPLEERGKQSPTSL